MGGAQKGGRFKFTAEVDLQGREGGRGNAVEIRGVQLERVRLNHALHNHFLKTEMK